MNLSHNPLHGLIHIRFEDVYSLSLEAVEEPFDVINATFPLINQLEPTNKNGIKIPIRKFEDNNNFNSLKNLWLKGGTYIKDIMGQLGAIEDLLV